VAGWGEICALAAPLAWSVAVILYRRTDAPASAMNLFKNGLAAVLLTLTMLALGSGPPADRTGEDWGRIVISALLGLSLADTLLFEGLRRVGAAGIAVVDTIYAPTVVVLSWLLLAERPTSAFLVGAAAVIVGIGVANWQRGALRAENRAQISGLAYGFGAILCTAAAVLIVKPVLAESDLIEVTWARLCVGVVGQVLWLAAAGRWREAYEAFRPAPYWKTLLPAAFIGTYVSMILWLGGFKWADASVAAVLNQMATVYILALARGVLGEALRPNQVVGAGLAATGALGIVLTRL
jgi:drug/metabolite transporter (DMT)-like permease